MTPGAKERKVPSHPAHVAGLAPAPGPCFQRQIDQFVSHTLPDQLTAS